MEDNQVLLCNELRNEKHEFLDKILENCNIDDLAGCFYCKRCGNVVHVDWYRN